MTNKEVDYNILKQFVEQYICEEYSSLSFLNKQKIRENLNLFLLKNNYKVLDARVNGNKEYIEYVYNNINKHNKRYILNEEEIQKERDKISYCNNKHCYKRMCIKHWCNRKNDKIYFQNYMYARDICQLRKLSKN